MDLSASRQARFWANVKRSPEGCWEWQAYRMPNGYGRYHRDYLAHRYAYAASTGRIPAPGLEVGHNCDNRACVRPDHLVLCTHRQNFEDGKSRGRIARLTWDAVKQIRASLANHHEVARKHGIHPEHVRRIRLNAKWPDDNYTVNPAHFPGRGHRAVKGR